MEKPVFQQRHVFVDNNTKTRTKTRLQKQAPPSLNLAHLLPTTATVIDFNNSPIPLLTPLFAPPQPLPQQEAVGQEFCFPVFVNKNNNNNNNNMMMTAASMEAAGVWHQYQHPSPLENIDHQGSSLFNLFHSKCVLVNRAQ